MHLSFQFLFLLHQCLNLSFFFWNFCVLLIFSLSTSLFLSSNVFLSSSLKPSLSMLTTNSIIFIVIYSIAILLYSSSALVLSIFSSISPIYLSCSSLSPLFLSSPFFSPLSLWSQTSRICHTQPFQLASYQSLSLKSKENGLKCI